MARDPLKPPVTPSNWPTVDPAAVGLVPARLEAADAETRARRPEVHSVLVARQGALVWERYYPAHERDLIWGNGGGELLGDWYELPADADQVHNIKSCTKSVMACLVGIAVDRRDLVTVDLPVREFLPDYLSHGVDTRKGDITMRHLLEMRSGLRWAENRQVTLDWIASPDPIAFTLERQDLVAPPGQRWEYSTADTHLLSACLASAVGTDVATYANAHLFGPLGFQASRWLCDGLDRPIGGSELFLRPREMLAFGELCRRGGCWGERQVIPRHWVANATAPQDGLDTAFFDQSYAAEGLAPGYQHHRDGYGLQWWITSYAGHHCYYAHGYGGQQIAVFPQLELVVVTTFATEMVAHPENLASAAPRLFSDTNLVRDYLIPAIIP